MDLSGGVYEAHCEDFSFESFCLPVHSAGGLAESWFLTHCQLMSYDRSIRRPLFFSGGLLVGALQVGYNQRVMDKCTAVHGAQTKTPRMAARRLKRKTRLELFLVIYWKSMFYTKLKRHQVKHRWNFRGFSGRMGEATWTATWPP